MSKKKSAFDSKQGELFARYLKPEGPPEPGSLNVSAKIRQAISNAITKSGLERIDICGAIYKATGIEVPKSTLDGWSAEGRDFASPCIDNNHNKRWGMSVDVLPAFCEITADFEVLFALVEACRYKALKGKDVVRARVGLLKEEITKKQQELKELEKALVEGK